MLAGFSGVGGGVFRFLDEIEAAGDASVDIVGMDETYAAYLLLIEQVYGSVAADLCLRLSNDGGTSFKSTGYLFERLGADGAFSTAAGQFNLTGNIGGSSQSYKAGGLVWLVGMGDADAAKVAWQIDYGRAAAGALSAPAGVGRLIDAANADAARLMMSSGNITGKVRVYGVQ